MSKYRLNVDDLETGQTNTIPIEKTEREAVLRKAKEIEADYNFKDCVIQLEELRDGLWQPYK